MRWENIVSRMMNSAAVLVGLGLIVAVAINLANVVSRYVLDQAITGADEVLVFIMVWCVFLGAAVATWHDKHLKMDLVVQMTSPGVRRLLVVASLVALVLVAGFVTVQSWQFFSRIRSIGQVSLGAEIPMTVPHGALTLGFALIAAMALMRLFRILRYPTDLDASSASELAREEAVHDPLRHDQ